MSWLLKNWKLILALALVVSAGFALDRLFRKSVVVTEARLGDAVDAVTGTAKVFSWGDVTVKNEKFGRITEMHVSIGSMVKKGDIIAVQSAPDLEIRLASLRRRLEVARKRLEIENPLSYEVEDMEKVVAASELSVSLQQEPVSRLEANRRELEKRRARLNLETLNIQDNAASLEEQLRQAELEKEQMTTRAPYAGKVIEVFAFVGDQIWGNSNLVRLVAPGRCLEITLNEEDFYGCEPNQPVTLRLADSGTKSRKVYAEIEGTDDELVPGLTGEAMIIKGRRKNTVIIPRRALMSDRVYVVESGKVSIRRIKPGFIALNVAEVAEGLLPGDLVVLEGQPGLSQGMRVRPDVVKE